MSRLTFNVCVLALMLTAAICSAPLSVQIYGVGAYVMWALNVMLPLFGVLLGLLYES